MAMMGQRILGLALALLTSIALASDVGAQKGGGGRGGSGGAGRGGVGGGGRGWGAPGWGVPGWGAPGWGRPGWGWQGGIGPGAGWRWGSGAWYPGYSGSYYGYQPGYYYGQGYDGYQSYYPPVEEQPGFRMRIIVPTDDAEVWISGEPTRQRGRVRVYESPPLEPGSYSYTVRARWREDGRDREETRTIRFHPGDSMTVDFTPKEESPPAPRKEKRP